MEKKSNDLEMEDLYSFPIFFIFFLSLESEAVFQKEVGENVV